MRVRVNHSPEGWSDLGPSHATLKGIRGSLVIGGPAPVDPQRRENLAAAQRAYRERKREKVA